MEEDILEKDLKLEKGSGEETLKEAIEVLNANFSTKDTSPDTFCDFDFDQTRVGQFFTDSDLGNRTADLTLGSKNFVESQDNSWETFLPCTASFMQRHSPETTLYQDLDDHRKGTVMPFAWDIRRDKNNILNEKLCRTKYFENQGSSISSSWEFGNDVPFHNGSRAFQSSSTVFPSNYYQPTFSTTYSGPRESERVMMGPERRPNYMSFSSRCAGREHFHVPCLSSSLSGTKISSSGESLPKRNKTPTALCSSCMQNVSANGGNFQRHQEACRRRQGYLRESQNVRMVGQDFLSDPWASMTVTKKDESPLTPCMEEDSGTKEEEDKIIGGNRGKGDKNAENSKLVQSILENFRESDKRDTHVLSVLQELRNTLMQNLDTRCIHILRESFVALAQRSNGYLSDISTCNTAPLPGEQIAMAILFYASC
ncbi:hypothetical protein GpartN1_g3571.t1 [Galdieria partita]|uniref:Uncharacterized protein n=1 Tax=Galdieria partita TaxID=83374 RepID=A0A9C7PWF4_9RHOD|nr:hypothetical protein GpartN1_g3571.t1 [Galdieria partita]